MNRRRMPLRMMMLGAVCAWLVGCAQKSDFPRTDLTYQRGVQLLSAGSPKTAIPLLTQVVASVPDGPEPHAMLSLAYALDGQSERALAQAAQVKRRPGDPPGWERMAMGIAEMSRGQSDVAVTHFKHLADALPSDDPRGLAARQWMALALLLQGDDERATTLLDELTAVPSASHTARLWLVLVHAWRGNTDQSAAALTQAAGDAGSGFRVRVTRTNLQHNELEDDHVLYEAALHELASGNLAQAEAYFALLQQRDARGSDAPSWLALIAAAKGEWTVGRSRLRNACQVGATRSQGVAHQLHGVVCAMEGMPEHVVRSMVAGQRLLGRSTSPAHAVTQPEPDSVWFSDAMK